MFQRFSCIVTVSNEKENYFVCRIMKKFQSQNYIKIIPLLDEYIITMKAKASEERVANLRG